MVFYGEAVPVLDRLSFIYESCSLPDCFTLDPDYVADSASAWWTGERGIHILPSMNGIDHTVQIERSSRGLWTLVLPAAVLLAWIFSACSGVSVQPERDGQVLAADTVLSRTEVAIHLRFLNSDELRGRATGTRGFVRAAAYVSTRLFEYGLQPIVPGEFGRVYAAPLHYAQTVEFVQFTPDTLRLETGIDVYPDGRTDAGSVRFQYVLKSPGPEVELSGRVVWIPSEEATDGRVNQMAARGASTIIIEGPIGVRLSSRPVPDVMIVCVAEGTLRRLTTHDLIPGPGSIRLAYESELTVAAQYVSVASAQNLYGMVIGSHPVYRNELVIVAARMDGFGAVGDAVLTDASDLGVGAAAVLESARLAAALQEMGQTFERTLLFAFLSGSHTGQAGLRAFLEYPPWARDSIHSLVYLSDQNESTEDVTRFAGEAGLSLEIIAQSGIPDPIGFRFRSDLFRGQAVDRASDAAVEIAGRAMGLIRELTRWK